MLKKLDSIKAFLFEVSASNVAIPGLRKLPTYLKSAAAAKSSQSCPTPSDPIDCSLPGSSIQGIFQASVLEWGAIAYSLSHV